MQGTGELDSSGELRGWILWREAEGEEPRFRPGVLRFRDGVIVGFETLKQTGGLENYVVPGFVDLHSHLAIGARPLTSSEIKEQAWAEIRAGVLAVREPGSPVRVDPADLPFGRPIVVSAGRHIAVEKRYGRGLAVELPQGSGDLAAEVLRQATSGDGWVKLVGDWIDRSAGEESDLRPLWSREQLINAVAVAHRQGVRVAVHAFGSEVVDDLLEAGVDSIEHGTGMSRAQMDRARQQGVVVVPTLLQVLKFPEFASAATRYPCYAKTMTQLYSRRRAWFSELLASGVTLLPGSDAGGYQTHGSLIREMQLMVEWGMPPHEVLNAATWRARDFLGLSSLTRGSPVDAVVFDEDPRTSPAIWEQPKVVVARGHSIFTIREQNDFN
ncbi:amidohydrolase family protein [Actinomyces minihominis]|uniref:amidohydrolase family protein n=1 Tax=Actinomyces minihominis TaxID=2002838 RepID=UPI000C07F05D|nr:amidohydrolase family protein [Actinomyces minihominis]